jgi:hypothetical protein
MAQKHPFKPLNLKREFLVSKFAFKCNWYTYAWVLLCATTAAVGLCTLKSS